MKKLSAILFLGILVSLEGKAQRLNDETFLPTSLASNTFSGLESSYLTWPSFKVNVSKILPYTNSFLFSSLKLVEGLKYQTALDQFSSPPMFDLRAYQPASFRDYNEHLSRNYHMLNSSFPKVW